MFMYSCGVPGKLSVNTWLILKPKDRTKLNFKIICIQEKLSYRSTLYFFVNFKIHYIQHMERKYNFQIRISEHNIWKGIYCIKLALIVL